MQANLARVIDLFKEWDDDGNGEISKREFRLALPMLGLKVEKQVMDDLFDSFDKDGSGTVEYKELQRQLRPKIDPQAEAKRRLLKAKSMPKLPSISGKKEFEDATAAEQAARKRLARIQKDLLRAASTSALKEQTEQRRMNNKMQRHQMDVWAGRALNARLKMNDVTPMNDTEVAAIAILFHKQMDAIFPDPAERVWYKLYSYMDDDKNGHISFKELKQMVRSQLRLAKAELPHSKLESLWVALDEDRSGMISAGEFGRFMKKGAPKLPQEGPRAARKMVLERKATERALIKAEQAVLVGRDVADRMLLVDAATEDEVVEMAFKITERIGSKVLPPTDRNWIKFFNLIDDDHSGRISYQEFEYGMWRVLKFTKSELPEKLLRSVWKAVDDDASGYISVGEFGRWMKKSAAIAAKHEEEKKRQADAELRRRQREEIERAEDARLRAAARRSAALARQFELDAMRLERAMKKVSNPATRKNAAGWKKSFELRGGDEFSPGGAGAKSKGASDDSTAAALGAPIHQRSSSFLPPIRLGPGVDF